MRLILNEERGKKMINKIIYLKEIFSGLKDSTYNPTLTTYIADSSREIRPGDRRPSIVICPGGGYEFTSDREAEPIAIRFMAAGFNAFVLRYSVSPNRYPAALLEVSAAVAYVRSMADEWMVDEDKIVVCGFSAGGHLTGSLGVFWDQEFIQEELDIKQGQNKPNALILSYPVISSGVYAHAGSFDNLLGQEASKEEREKFSLEKHVSINTPPAFIWHTLDDGTVPVENALLFAQALKEKNILFELHIYHHGVHGLSLGDESTANRADNNHINPHAGTWFNLVLQWLREILHVA